MHSGKKKLSLRYCKHDLLFCLLSCFFVLSRTLLKVSRLVIIIIIIIIIIIMVQTNETKQRLFCVFSCFAVVLYIFCFFVLSRT